ncbi:MAG: hypothetical protein VX278_07515 [Myxococcota bacterium]|nr:hypothetical protein [Myxococcota bacterium]
MNIVWLSLLGCSEKIENAEEERAWVSAPLAELSSGECPDMSVSGEATSFLSSGETRTVTTVFPSNPQPGMGIIYWFHGFVDTSITNLSAETADSMMFQSLADQENAVIIVPEATIWDLSFFQVYMWNVEDGTYEHDVTLFDDLRTCVSQSFDVNLDKLTVGGWSAGALFTTVLMSHRSDTLAAVAQLSGGADLDIEILGLFEEPLSVYETPSHTMPILLGSGQEEDIWPQGMGWVNFYEATTYLEEKVREDGHFVVRCLHSNDHWGTPYGMYNSALSWLTDHTYGEESPFKGDTSTLASCEE